MRVFYGRKKGYPVTGGRFGFQRLRVLPGSNSWNDGSRGSQVRYEKKPSVFNGFRVLGFSRIVRKYPLNKKDRMIRAGFLVHNEISQGFAAIANNQTILKTARNIHYPNRRAVGRSQATPFSLSKRVVITFGPGLRYIRGLRVLRPTTSYERAVKKFNEG